MEYFTTTIYFMI